MSHDIDCGAVGCDSATWGRPESGNDLGQFVRNRMSEPYVLGKANCDTMQKPGKEERRKEGKKKKRRKRREEKRREEKRSGEEK